MKNIKAITFLTFFSLISINAFATEHMHGKAKDGHVNHKDHNHKDQGATVKKINKEKLVIKVKGMVCAFCAQGIEKNFNKRDEVKNTKVDLDNMEVFVELKKGKILREEVIKKIVVDAGFSYAGMK